MEGQLKISPEELFFLGKQMRAKYIDYDYVKMMGDLQQKYPLKEKEIMAGLVKRGLLMEDFSGNMELNEEIRNLLEPVFFGDFEVEIILGTPKEGWRIEKFHFYKGKIIQTVPEKKSLIFFAGGENGLKKLKEELLPEGYTGEKKILSGDSLNLENVEKILVIKNMKIGYRAMGRQFLLFGGTWNAGKEDRTEGQNREELEKFWNVLTGEVQEYVLL